MISNQHPECEDRCQLREHKGYDTCQRSGECQQPLRIIHVLRLGEPRCPKCGQGLESEGGSVVPAGSWDEGPLWWECEDCREQWGHA